MLYNIDDFMDCEDCDASLLVVLSEGVKCPLFSKKLFTNQKKYAILKTRVLNNYLKKRFGRYFYESSNHWFERHHTL